MTGDTRTLAVIRTHRWDEDARRLCDQLHPIFGNHLVVVFHDRSEDLCLPVRVADISDSWLQLHGLRVVKDWGWRCGDYFLYRARDAFPDYDEYWMIEPDIFFAGKAAEFFEGTRDLPHDVLGVHLSAVKVVQRFGRGMPTIPLYRSLFALTRFSAFALDQLFDLRRAYSAGRVAQRFFANDEIFCFSHAMAALDLTCESLSVAMPRWIDPARLVTDPDILLELLADHPGPGVFHPVRGRASFARAIAARIAQNTHFIAEIHRSLACLTDAELEAIADDARLRCHAILLRERGLARDGRPRAAD